MTGCVRTYEDMTWHDSATIDSIVRYIHNYSWNTPNVITCIICIHVLQLDEIIYSKIKSNVMISYDQNANYFVIFQFAFNYISV